MLSRRQCVSSALLYSSREAVLPAVVLALFIDMISWPMTAGDLSVRELGANYPELRRRRSTRRSSLVTLARPPTSSSLCITDRSFRYAPPCVWNQLPSSLRQPHSVLFVSDLPVPAPTTSSHAVDSPLYHP